MSTRPAPLHLGEIVDPATHARSGTPVTLAPAALTTHGVIVGQTGSGKTGLAMAMLEEAMLAGVPCVLIDPKGDLANIALTFPGLSAAEFAPWVEQGDPAVAALQWKDGLAGWGIDGTDITTLHDRAEVVVWTPGSTAGRALNLVGSLRAPTNAPDAEARADEVSGTVSGLLGLIGVESDPLSGREHILLANLVERSWAAGSDLTLEALLTQIQTPPMRKLGVLELDTFYPEKDRTALVMKLNGLLASPSFASWAAGDPLEIATLLRNPAGKARASVVSIAHLSDEERQFAVARILGALITWMRAQPGTSDLRVLLYIDEVLGYVPPTANPATKGPILTLVKQGRAFGVGVVLATQNPVDVDYKVLSNATTWMIGRLQTERDRDRLLEGMRSAAGGVDIDALAATISGLAKREFVLQRAGADNPLVFTSRWAMSYLRGPLTREQISRLTPQAAAPGTAGATAETAASAPAAQAAALADNEVTVAPKVVAGRRVAWADPASPWLAQVGGSPTGTRFEAALAARIQLMFDDDKAAIRETQEWEAIVFPLSSPLDPASAVQVDHDERDFRVAAPAVATYVLPEADLTSAAWWKGAESRLTDQLVSSKSLSIARNETLGLWGRPGETDAEFAARCDSEADARSDKDGAKLHTTLQAKIDRVKAAIDTAEANRDQAQAANRASRTHELIAGAGDLLGALLGGRKSVRSITRVVKGASSRRASSSRAEARMENVDGKVSQRSEELQGLEQELSDQLLAIDAKWTAASDEITSVDIPLERSDLRVLELQLVWLPVP